MHSLRHASTFFHSEKIITVLQRNLKIYLHYPLQTSVLAGPNVFHRFPYPNVLSREYGKNWIFKGCFNTPLENTPKPLPKRYRGISFIIGLGDCLGCALRVGWNNLRNLVYVTYVTYKVLSHVTDWWVSMSTGAAEIIESRFWTSRSWLAGKPKQKQRQIHSSLGDFSLRLGVWLRPTRQSCVTWQKAAKKWTEIFWEVKICQVFPLSHRG